MGFGRFTCDRRMRDLEKTRFYLCVSVGRAYDFIEGTQSVGGVFFCNILEKYDNILSVIIVVQSILHTYES